jgi:tetraacyldisaccharide 4'-kinase
VRERLLDQLWESGNWSARVARAALTPLGWAFGAAVALRNHAYDSEWLGSEPLALPTISVGNLTVGGTGKTPVSAWLASRLRAAGARPAIVLRGYGGDEPLVHERLNPGTPIIVDRDRVRGVERAKAAHATVAVLDDGFQHRRAQRDADIVLLSADRFGPVRTLPAGPWREPLTALARARMVIVTRKHASPLRARELLSHAMRFASGASGGVIHLSMDALMPWGSGPSRSLEALSGRAVLVISAIGDPRAFESQLRSVGARVDSAAYPDHHRFSQSDAAQLAERAAAAAYVVCTLKDAVKLALFWPRAAPPLWYLSQRVIVESGGEVLDRLVAEFSK